MEFCLSSKAVFHLLKVSFFAFFVRFFCTIYVVDSAWFWLECLERYVDTCELTFQTKWIKYPEKFSPQCQKLANIGLKMYFMCFYSICPGASLTRAGEWEIWSVSGRLLDSPHELAWMYNTGRFTASFPARGW